MAIFRPAIVTSTASEPVEGWTDNFYGPTAVLHGINTGVFRTSHCDSSNNANLVPVDYCVNALLSSAWDVATNAAGRRGENMLIYNYVSSVENPTNWKELTEENTGQNLTHPFSGAIWRGENMLIYNYVSSVENPTNWKELTEENTGQNLTHPFSGAIWYSSMYMHKSATINKLYRVILHFIPGILFDVVASCVGTKPRLLKIYRKIHKFANALEYFCIHNIRFSNSNVQTLCKKLEKDDQKIFNFNIVNLDWKNYYKNYVPGMRRYLLKEDGSTLESARRKWKRLYCLHQLVKLISISLLMFACWVIFRKLVYSD